MAERRNWGTLRVKLQIFFAEYELYEREAKVKVWHRVTDGCGEGSPTPPSSQPKLPQTLGAAGARAARETVFFPLYKRETEVIK